MQAKQTNKHGGRKREKEEKKEYKSKVKLM